MKTLIRMPEIIGQDPQYKCPHCGEVQYASHRQLKCRNCKRTVINPDKQLEQKRKQDARVEEQRRLAKESKMHSSVAAGPGERGQEYILWRDAVVYATGLKRGDLCPCCNEVIDRNENMVVLHHILDRAAFPEISRSLANVFPGCNGKECGNRLDVKRAGSEARLVEIDRMSTQIVRAMHWLPARDHLGAWLHIPADPGQLIEWCIEQHRQQQPVPLDLEEFARLRAEAA